MKNVAGSWEWDLDKFWFDFSVNVNQFEVCSQAKIESETTSACNLQANYNAL